MNTSNTPSRTQYRRDIDGVVEATIEDLRSALDAGVITSVELVALYLARIGYYDHHGLHLNSVPIVNPDVFAEAEESDRRRAHGHAIRPLEGIPFIVKDSYSVAGLTVACGSPAFKHLVATRDAWTVASLRSAGAILLGKSNTPPMMYGGMERGLYGRAESPYNKHYLTAAYASGSSNGSATATAASLSAFALGSETVSSGRSPASNNGLVAYTPSRGLISTRGSWPLYPTCDVVVPYTRTVNDLFALLDVLVAEDPDPAGQLWREQHFVALPEISAVRPKAYATLADVDALRGKRIGVPKMYLGKDTSLNDPIMVRPSIKKCWDLAAAQLTALGATLVETDFPVVSNYDQDRDGVQNMYERGFVPEAWRTTESCDLIAYGWQQFLSTNNDPQCSDLSRIDPSLVFPTYPGTIPKPESVHGRRRVSFVQIVQAAGKFRTLSDFPNIESALIGLERTRKIDFEDWLDANNLDFVVFPANADVGTADSDTDPVAHANAWRNGVMYSNGARVIRHLGIPTVVMPMGVMDDTGMPVGLTFAGKAYHDNDLLQAAYAFENGTCQRQAPPLTPSISGLALDYHTAPIAQSATCLSVTATATRISCTQKECTFQFSGKMTGTGRIKLCVIVNGHSVPVIFNGDKWQADVQIPIESAQPGVVDNPYFDSALAIVLAKDDSNEIRGQLKIVALSD